MKWAQKQKGFTIVELLIVIVVIAILAAITIVSYNGISQRAKESTAQNTVAQTSKRIFQDSIEKGDVYPDTLASIGINNAGSTTYQYSVNNTSTPKSFCVTATVNNVSYFASNTTTNPTKGACPGHGANGAAVIRNLMPNPSVEVTGGSWTVSNYGTGGAGTASIPTTGGASGSRFYRLTWSTANTGGEPYMLSRSSSVVTPGTAYTCSGSVRTSVNANVSIRLVFVNSASAWLTPVPSSPASSLTGGTSWTRLSISGTAPANSAAAWCLFVIQSTNMSVNATFDADAVMLTEGSTLYPYADGSTNSQWAWEGDEHSSISRGPAL